MLCIQPHRLLHTHTLLHKPRIEESPYKALFNIANRGRYEKGRYHRGEVRYHTPRKREGRGRITGDEKRGERLKRILDAGSNSTKLLIELSAGQGEIIGDRFEEIAEILEGVGDPDLGVCLDTAHVFASGYDIRTEEAVRKTLDEFSFVIGLEKLKLL